MMRRTITLGEGRSLAFAEAGSGTPVVLIHGALASGTDWSPDLCSWLATRSRVVVVDRPGHGESSRPRFHGSPRAQARQIREALGPKLGSPAILVGHSFGAYTALAYAEAFPSEIAALLLLAPIGLPELRPFEHFALAPCSAPFVGPMISEAARPMFGPAFLSAVHRLMFAPQPVPPEWQARYPFDRIGEPGHLVREGEDAASILPWSPEGYLNLQAVRAPVRILAGGADAIVEPSRQARPLSRLLPDADLRLVPGVGHMIHHGAAELVREGLGELLGALPQRFTRTPRRTSPSARRRRRPGSPGSPA